MGAGEENCEFAAMPDCAAADSATPRRAPYAGPSARPPIPGTPLPRTSPGQRPGFAGDADQGIGLLAGDLAGNLVRQLVLALLDLLVESIDGALVVQQR